jgi:deazaflavin-dependent oxidoreductase (nitroreductase family)
MRCIGDVAMSVPLAWRLANAIHVGFFQRTVGVVDGGRSYPVLTTIGRKTDRARTAPLFYVLDDDGHRVIIASQAGRPENPAWDENLEANPRVTYQTRGEIRAARDEGCIARTSRTVVVEARYDGRGYTRHQENTSRIIPVVLLRPAS